jgi:hypothetical protein
MTHMKHQHHRGISAFGLIFVLVILAFIGAVGMQALPTFMEYGNVVKAVAKVAKEPSVAEVRTAFDKAAQVDDIKSIKGADLQIERTANGNVVKFFYEKEIHLFSVAYLLLKYEGESK